jgi:FdhD protein
MNAAGGMKSRDHYLVAPDPEDPSLSAELEVTDEEGRRLRAYAVQERPLTIFLNGQEIITAMTIGDHPDWLAVGYLRNQAMLRDDDEITAIDYEPDISTIVVRTRRQTDYEQKMRRKVHTSGCAQGTVFGDVMEQFEKIRLPDTAVLRTSWLYALLAGIAATPSLYHRAGSIHGCVLCQEDRPLVYVEDVGRHNAVDKIAGWMFLNRVPAEDKIFFTTGRLTSEMVLKCAAMGIPILISRSGFTAWGVELARKVNMTLVGRARGQRFLCASGEHRIIRDVPVARGRQVSRGERGKDRPLAAHGRPKP